MDASRRQSEIRPAPVAAKAGRSRFMKGPSAPTSSIFPSSTTTAGMFTTTPASPSNGRLRVEDHLLSTATKASCSIAAYPIEELAEHGDFLETCYLLLYGELPTAAQKADSTIG